MKRLAFVLALASLAALPFAASAQTDLPPLPTLTPTQSQQVRQEIDRYRSDTENRVARGEITPDEAERLLQWRQWQVAQQVAGLAPAPPAAEPFVGAPGPYAPAPYPYPYYYRPYYAPYYAGPPYWGLSFCAGRSFHRGFGSFCI
jgi:hypothetical protein